MSAEVVEDGELAPQHPETHDEATAVHRPQAHRDRSPMRLGRPARADIAVVLGAYLASRLVVLLAAKAATWYAKPLTVSGALASWDGGWYLSIAKGGYPARLVNEGGGDRWAFFPALPALTRAVHTVTRLDWQTSGLVVAALAGAVAVVGVFLAVREVLGSEAGVTAATLLCFLPNAYVLSMVYTDGLFIAGATFCIWFLVRRQWLLAGLAAALAGLTRSSALVLVACCAWEAVRVGWQDRTLRPFVAPLLAPAGVVAFTAYGWAVTAEPVPWMTAQRYWQNEFDWFRPVGRAVVDVFTNRDTWQDTQSVLAVLALGAALGGLVLLWWVGRRHRVPSVWWVYCGLTILLALTPFWLTSVPRYMVPLFPLLGALAVAVPKRWRPVLVASSAVVMGVLAMGVFISTVTWSTAPLAP